MFIFDYRCTVLTCGAAIPSEPANVGSAIMDKINQKTLVTELVPTTPFPSVTITNSPQLEEILEDQLADLEKIQVLINDVRDLIAVESQLTNSDLSATVDLFKGVSSAQHNNNVNILGRLRQQKSRNGLDPISSNFLKRVSSEYGSAELSTRQMLKRNNLRHGGSRLDNAALKTMLLTAYSHPVMATKNLKRGGFGKIGGGFFKRSHGFGSIGGGFF